MRRQHWRWHERLFDDLGQVLLEALLPSRNGLLVKIGPFVTMTEHRRHQS